MRNVPTRLGCILFAFLAACNSQNVPQPGEPAVPATVSHKLVPTLTLVPFMISPSPMPTAPVAPFITPDPIQVERWQEYEDALAKAFFKSYLQPEEVVCEWEILGRTDDQEVYVSAYCASIYSAGPSQAWIPSVIHIEMDGSVQSAEIPGAGTSYAVDIRRMFPLEVQEMIFGRVALTSSQEMEDRMRWRRGHPDDPPWIVFSALGIQPTQPIMPWVAPEPVQVERWKEYQTALANEFDYRPPEQVICEWEFLGRSGNEIYLWVVCGEMWGSRVGLEGLARIDVLDDGTVVGVRRSDHPHLYPSSVLEYYYGGQIHFQELVDHLRWRQQGHFEEPPLVVLSATPIP